MRVYKNSSDLDWGCGVTVVGNFQRPAAYYTTKLSNLSSDYSGTGYYISSFINNNVCQAAYEFIEKNFDIVFQSPVTVNKNTDNDFFFIVYRKK